VVAHLELDSALVPLSTLPAGFIEFQNVEECEGKIRTSFLGKRGIYLFTNQTNGHQYVGSAMNLSSRLSDYYSDSYLKLQVNRGSIISQAIIKHGHSNFSLQVSVLGLSPLREDISVNSDFIQLEQYYLDNYELVYNARRLALGPAPVSNNKSIHEAELNPQFGKFGTAGAAWDLQHSKEQKELWSLTRSTPLFIYDASELVFKLIIYGYDRLAHYLNVFFSPLLRGEKSC
jgi:group I intron endonuclease